MWLNGKSKNYPIWSNLVQFGPIWSNLVQFGPIGPGWSNLVQVGPLDKVSEKESVCERGKNWKREKEQGKMRKSGKTKKIEHKL